MFLYTVVALSVLSLVSSNDLELGPKEGGRKILDELRKASPLLWRRENAVYVRTTDDEIIHRIVVADLRDNKDGIARVVEGGIGENEVLLELSSPGVLKGYEFHVQVYSTPNTNAKTQDNAATVKQVANPNNADVSRVANLRRRKRSWFGQSGEDYGSYSGSDESNENVKDDKVKPLEKNPSKEEKPKIPEVSPTEKPQVPAEPAITNPRQIIDSLPPLNGNADESTAIPSTVQPETSPEVSLTPDLSSPQPLPVAADGGLPSTLPAQTTDQTPGTPIVDARSATSSSADSANLNSTVSSPLATGQ